MMIRKKIIVIFTILLAIAGTILLQSCSKDECQCEKYDDSYLCDPDIPVVLNGDTIPEGRIERGSYGCVTKIDMTGLDITDANCLDGIENYSSMLEILYIGQNNLDSINLSPLSSCEKLEILVISETPITSLDLTPLSNCKNLYQLSLDCNQLTTINLSPIMSLEHIEFLIIQSNNLDIAGCEQICSFAEAHPDCHIETDCDCGGK